MQVDPDPVEELIAVLLKTKIQRKKRKDPFIVKKRKLSSFQK